MELDWFSDYFIFGNSLYSYAVALAVFLLSMMVLKIFKYVVLKRMKKFSVRTRTEVDDLAVKFIGTIGWPFYVLLAAYISFRFIALPQTFSRVLHYAILILGTFYVVLGIQKIIDHGTKKIVAKHLKENKDKDTSAIDLMKNIAKAVLWIIAVILILSNIGYNVSGLLAGLGIGGIAIAFALQNVLSDMFASFSIYFDKPFQIGDFIIIGNDMGTVKRVGIKSTRIQTLQGQELIVSNKELTETRINNYKKMEKRRVLFNFGVTYNTPVPKLRKIPGIVRQIVGSFKLAELDRVHFREFGNFSLNFEVVYYLNSKDYNVYMDTHQEINLKLKKAFENEKIEMAFPTQTIHLAK
ncbi:mechanosensitive ion channel family protein [Candidatus Woesearchaeota archaeon]|nr:mechanosensitive ion channel family protein [Candidatus Woesearchaeota archaeon]